MGNKNKYRMSFIVSAFILFPYWIISVGAAEAQQCPPLLAALMPKNAVKVTCQYNSSGIIGLGFAAGDLPFEHPCVNQTTKFPGRITFDVKHYSGDGVAIFKMQIGPEEQQRINNKKSEFEKKLKKNSGAGGASMKTESFAGGTIIYTEQFIDCSEGVKRYKPLVNLLAVAHTESTAINIEINGFISAEIAKSAAMEMITNFKKTNFETLERAK
jgi:hypothetical protein